MLHYEKFFFFSLLALKLFEVKDLWDQIFAPEFEQAVRAYHAAI